MTELNDVETAAQQWHEQHHYPDENGLLIEGSCYCCCWRCNDETDGDNPHYRAALNLWSNGAKEPAEDALPPTPEVTE